MLNRSILKTSLLIAGLATLGACGGDSSDDDPTDLPIVTGDMELDTDNDDGADPDSGDTDVSVVDVPDLANPVPQIVTAACGDLPISETQFSNTAGAPTVITANEIVRGRVDPDSATNTTHFWNVELQPGFYHLVIDNRRVDDERSNIGLEVVDLKGAGEDDDEILLRNNEVAYGYRQLLFFEVETANTLNLQVSPRHDAEDYTFGIFENGSPVPSPVMEECPSISTLSLDSTESLVLPSYDSDADELWYQVQLELGDYIMSANASRVDGENRNIIYRFRAVDQFGQNDRFQSVTAVNEVDTSFSSSDVLTVSEDGLVWVRLRSGTAPQNIEFTLSPDN